MKTLDVPLKESDREWIHLVARQRNEAAIKQGRRGAYGSVDAERAGVKKDICGCWGEMAVARAFNLFWDGTIGDIDKADVGRTLEVKSITTRGRCLILHDAYNDNAEKRIRPYILAFIGLAYSHRLITLCGYAVPSVALRGRKKEQRGAGAPAYYIPERELWDMGDIFDHVKEFER